MINKILKHGTAIGIALSSVGFIVSELFSLSAEYVAILEKIYQITAIISVLFILTVSKFINERFDKILKTIGIILLIMFGMNLSNELHIYRIESVEKIGLILISGLYFMYLNYFRKKKEKIGLDYLKIFLLTLVFIGGFLNQYGLYPAAIKIISQISFWIVLVGILWNEHKKAKLNYDGQHHV